MCEYSSSLLALRWTDAPNLLFARLQTRLPADGGSGADPLELEAALQQLQVTHAEPNSTVPLRSSLRFFAWTAGAVESTGVIGRLCLWGCLVGL